MTTITVLNTAHLKTAAVDAAAIGSALPWMGKLHQVDITDDGRKIAYPQVPEQNTQTA